MSGKLECIKRIAQSKVKYNCAGTAVYSEEVDDILYAIESLVKMYNAQTVLENMAMKSFECLYADLPIDNFIVIIETLIAKKTFSQNDVRSVKSKLDEKLISEYVDSNSIGKIVRRINDIKIFVF